MTNEQQLAFDQILEDRDELYRETARLKSQLNAYANFANERASYQSQLQQKDLDIQQKDLDIQQKTQAIVKLQEQIQALQRKIWGKSSERYINEDPQQRKIDFQGLDILPQEIENAQKAKEEIELNKTQRTKPASKERPVRKPLPKDLPREQVHLYPPNIDMQAYSELDPEVSEILEREPARWFVRQIIRHKYVLKDKSQAQENQKIILTAPMPALPIAKSYAGASVLSHITIGKYVYHQPFYRLHQEIKQWGIHIPIPTMVDWSAQVADLMRPAYLRLKEIILKSDYIQSDETTLPVINNEKHQAVKGYLWMMRAVVENLVLFHYDKGSRAQKVALALFETFQGVLQSDAYAVYDIYENKNGVMPIGCWAHVRRKFEEALSEDKERAQYALEQIALLYDVERHADQENLSNQERAQLRTRLCYPIMVAFEKWILAQYPKVRPRGRIGKALYYTYKNYHKLTRYHLDCKLKMDNNLAENAIRPIALGRKNWLFCGNHDAAENAAIIYSMLGTCKAHGVNFNQWLTFFLENVHSYDNDYSKDIAELLPQNFKAKAATAPQYTPEEQA